MDDPVEKGHAVDEDTDVDAVHANDKQGVLDDKQGISEDTRSSDVDMKQGVDMDIDALADRYWLTRILFLRCLGFLYSVAFLVALLQNEALIGENGLTPATTYLSHIRTRTAQLSHPAQTDTDTDTSSYTTLYNLISQVPTIFWLLPPTTLNLHLTAATGLLLSLLMSILGSANVPLLLLLWGLYFSLVSVGQTWYSFG
jgi:hypothetical protein